MLGAMSELRESPLLALHREVVPPEWIDYNGHMNMAYYLLAFDHASDRLFDLLDLGIAYRKRADHGLFTLEAHATYERELRLGDPLSFTTQLLDYDAKRIHYFHWMYHATEGYLAATNELICLHVDLSARRAAPLPTDALARLEGLMAAHRPLPRPPQAGRLIGIRRPRTE